MGINESRSPGFDDISFYKDSRLSVRPSDCDLHNFLESLNITILASLNYGKLIPC